MARLDQLIAAMFQHSAEALVVAGDQQPALRLNGAERACAKPVLDAGLVSQLLIEIAPPEAQAEILAGRDTEFVYTAAGRLVQVEVTPGPAAVLRPGQRRPEPPAVRAAGGAAPPAPAASRAPATAAPAAVAAVPVAAPATAERVSPPRPVLRADAPMMERLFHDLVRLGGSDVHVSSGSRPMIRVDGDLRELAERPVFEAAEAERVLLEIAPARNREEFQKSGDTDFAYEIPGLCRFRCNLFRDRKGPGGVCRTIPTEIVTAGQLGLSREIQALTHLTKGLVLVTGPTGSGKSTTLAALIDLVNTSRSDHVITIEDPIEFVHPNKKCLINQREVHIHTSGFKKALRAALREDPDVVLVGEMRDLETIAIAIETAETGHLVFGTLHTSSAVSTVDRIIDQFPADQQSQIRIMLSESLKAVLAQVLCKKIGGGRVAALEVLMVNAAISNLIREGKTFQIPSIMQTGKKLGMVMLNDALVELVQKKLIEPREAYLKALDKLQLISTFKAKNVPLDFLEPARSELQPA